VGYVALGVAHHHHEFECRRYESALRGTVELVPAAVAMEVMNPKKARMSVPSNERVHGKLSSLLINGFWPFTTTICPYYGTMEVCYGGTVRCLPRNSFGLGPILTRGVRAFVCHFHFSRLGIHCPPI
jgi:hypothetical protein